MCDKNVKYFKSDRRDVRRKFHTDTSIITKKSVLRFIKDYSYEEHVPPQQKAHKCVYPKANNYYAFNEDTNPRTRCNLIREWNESNDVQPHFEAPKEPHTIRDPYFEVEATRKYLETNPTSFVIFGKPDLNTAKLAKLLADTTNCILISPMSIIEEEMKRQTAKGESIAKMLKAGHSLGQEVVLSLIDSRIKERDISHRGYVIDGLPLIPNDLNLDYSCYPSNVIGTETSCNIYEQPSTFNICASVSKCDASKRIASAIGFKGEGGYREQLGTGVCKSKANTEQDIPRQIDEMFTLWPVRPSVIVYVMCPDEDVASKRDRFRIDPTTGDTIDTIVAEITDEFETLFSQEKTDNDVNFAYELYEGLVSEMHISEGRNKYLLKRIPDMKSNVEHQCEVYKRSALPVIEKWTLLHNPEKVIRVDGRTAMSQMFKIIAARLRTLPLQRSIIPKNFAHLNETEFAGESSSVSAADEVGNKENEEALHDLVYKGIISPRFPWRLSSWKFLCPVELAKGRTIDGRAKYAVQFMNMIFFLSSHEAMDLFVENPRTFLLPPYPRPTCKIAVLGPKYSGKSKLCKELASAFNGTAIDVNEIEKSLVKGKMKSKIDNLIREMTPSVISELKKNKEAERMARESERLSQLESWCNEIASTVDRILELARIAYGNNTEEEDHENYEELESLREKLRFYNLTGIEDDHVLQRQVREDKTLLRSYAPENLLTEEPPIPIITEHDAEVFAVLQDRVKHIYEDTVALTFDEKTSIVVKSVENIPREEIGTGIWRDGGYIVDGMYVDAGLWKIITEDSKIAFEDTIVLLDEEPYDYLATEWSRVNRIKKDLHEETDVETEEYADWLGVTSSDGSFINMEDTEESERSEYLEFLGQIEEFESRWATLKEIAIENCKNLIICNLKNADDIPRYVVDQIKDRYSDGARVVSDDEREREEQLKQLEQYNGAMRETENVNAIEEKDEEEDEPGDEERKGQDSKLHTVEHNRRLGDTNYYCPVALSRRNVLWRGKEEFSALFMDKIYLVSSGEALKEFTRNPAEFSIPYLKPRTVIPPLRVAIVGPSGSGKSTISEAISREYGLTHVDYFNQFTKYMKDRGIPSFSRRDVLLSEDSGANDVELPDELQDEKYNSDGATVQAFIRRYWKIGGFLPEKMFRECSLNFFKGPYGEHGIVFDGFPSCAQDLETAFENYTVPEMIIELRCGRDKSFGRVLPELLASWSDRQEEQKRVESTRYAEEWEDYTDKRDQWITRVLRERREGRRADRGPEREDAVEYNEEVSEDGASSSLEKYHEQDEDYKIGDTDSEEAMIERTELEEVWRQEHPEPLLKTDWKDIEVARERIAQQLEETYDSDSEKLQLVRETMESESIPWTQVDAEKSTQEVLLEIMRILDPYVFRNESFFERTYTIARETAESLLDCGYYFLSSFGRWCPVQLYENKNPVQMFLPLEAKQEIYPVVHRKYVYFLGGREAHSAFLNNPLKYLQGDSCAPLIPFRVCITGPPKCGKTTLAQRFSMKYGMKIITRGKALRRALKNFSWTELARRTESDLRAGHVASDESVSRAVEMYSIDPRSISQGLIFDGFPSTRKEFEALAVLALQPMIVLDLDAGRDVSLEYLLHEGGQRSKPPTFSSEFLTRRYETWKAEEMNFRNWLKKFAQNVVEIDASKSKWCVWTRADEAVRAKFRDIKLYFRESDYDKVHSVKSMRVSPYEFKTRQSQYESYCPVCLNYEDTMTTSGPPLISDGIFQFREHFYWICTLHTNDFVKNPLNHLPPLNTAVLSKERPRILRETVDTEHFCWARRLQSEGLCPVTYVNNFPRRKLVPGKPTLGVLLEDKVYLFCTLECRDKFLAQHKKYASVKIEFCRTLPPINVRSLPDLGFLEQTVARQIVRAVNEIGVARPKIPGLSASASAAICIGVYLKVHHSSCTLNEVDVYETVRKRILGREQIVKAVTRTMKRTLNPYVSVPEHANNKFVGRVSANSQISERSANFIKFRRTSPSQMLDDPQEMPH